MSCQLEPAIWSRDTGQRIPCFDRCQLIITWMSNTKEVHSKPRLHVSLSTCYLEYGSHLARLHRRRRRRCRRAYRPRAIPLAMITMRKSTHGFPFVSHIWVAYGAPLVGPSGRQSSAVKNVVALIWNAVFAFVLGWTGLLCVEYVRMNFVCIRVRYAEFKGPLSR